ncbi:secondary thiamine-phosphate synthase enzyme YjbQ [Paracoccus sp. Z330]|uniref:Secondary thiamine-phosphate synthase enzyme YjbQ n=1 Tax=Paracoccus onchidii TaxID=3017813 RepID=A0ABT4ZIE9_9RHOB|nr:secondary thiamine-phosphate synthase enzyme YjbQ [Paracoccus onchidii]MDB6178531.1 secondary thiamine-phosphate synthase enzyme YjbQ [Paracoccus onchidii]
MIGEFRIKTDGPGCHDFTSAVADWLTEGGAENGVLTLLVRHTSCSLLIQENADPDVQYDLLNWLGRLVPHTDHPSMHWITHRDEGPDDMSAHLKASVLPVNLSIPVHQSLMMLGQWQGIYLIEHRDAPHERRVAACFQSI